MKELDKSTKKMKCREYGVDIGPDTNGKLGGWRKQLNKKRRTHHNTERGSLVVQVEFAIGGRIKGPTGPQHFTIPRRCAASCSDRYIRFSMRRRDHEQRK